MLTIRHTHEDGTQLRGSAKGDGALDVLKPLGWTWRSWSGVHIRGSRDKFASRPGLERYAEALRAAGHEVTIEVDNTWRPAAVRWAEREERAEDRADRLDDRAAKAAARSTATRDARRRISDGIPLGQPILVGHHSEGRARRDIARMDALGTLLRLAACRASYSYNDPGRMLADHVAWAQRLVHGLDLGAADTELAAFRVDGRGVDERRDLAARCLAVYDRLAAGERSTDIAASLATVDIAPVWRIPDREPEDRRAGPCGGRNDTQPLIAAGDLVKGYYDTGMNRRLVRGFCGPVASVSPVNDRREAGRFVTIRLVDGTERDLQTHMWLAVYPAGTWEGSDRS